MANGSGPRADDLAELCSEIQHLYITRATGDHSVLLRLGHRSQTDDIADEVYHLLPEHLTPHEGILVHHVVADDVPAIEVDVVVPEVDQAVLEAAIDEIVVESQRLIELWNPPLPDTGA